MFSTTYYRNVDIVLLVMQLLSIASSGFMVFVFARSRHLRSNVSLWLIFVLSASDLLLAATTIPYVVYLIVAWNEKQLDYDGTTISLLGVPTPVQLKFKLVLTSAIALDRVQAIRFPFYYRTKKHRRYAAITVSLGLTLGLVDALLPFVIGYEKRRIGCPAAGCFGIAATDEYWSLSNAVLNLPIFVFTLVYVLSMNKIAATSDFEIRVMQANRLILTLLLMSICFLMVPACTVFADHWFNFAPFFYKLGPFYMFGLLLEGICNSFAYLTLHRETRDTARAMVFGSKFQQTSPSSATFVL